MVTWQKLQEKYTNNATIYTIQYTFRVPPLVPALARTTMVKHGNMAKNNHGKNMVKITRNIHKQCHIILLESTQNHVMEPSIKNPISNLHDQYK